jgi:hypothetical protein
MSLPTMRAEAEEHGEAEPARGLGNSCECAPQQEVPPRTRIRPVESLTHPPLEAGAPLSLPKATREAAATANQKR